ncbi:Dihydrofolate reductase [Denitrovibrio acetiphilus DSM 12809]|uniref:Dihydrofolate reductase n=1 Tax=Denitrovibrio acetiphilus (strain DSM 12809 / NBRC 114555 / N2460) TaxID=522772 RepID=D4H815_DENA2|nr:dihydrofolate reductase [Denitrovibrio acetiphilus]ADD68164.1 Dihydrofolate reductase [Denitrovibrio acetiphilus DSM 12809]
MTKALIVAMTKDRVIGKNNDMPWHLPEDLKLFKAKTTGHIIAMGRKTYESIGRPLPNRENFVITRSGKEYDGCRVFGSVQECIKAAEEYDKTLFFIGGGQIYSDAVDMVDEMHISYIKENYDGDTFFPEFDESRWKVTETEEYGDFIYKKFVRLSA